MLCDICQKSEATIFLTDARSHPPKEWHLCADCYRQMEAKHTPKNTTAAGWTSYAPTTIVWEEN